MFLSSGRQRVVLPLFLAAVQACDPAAGASGNASQVDASSDSSERTLPVQPGIDVLITDSLHLVRGLRVGLITNHTGVDGAGNPSIDRLAELEDAELVALYAPEHGIRGAVEAGEHVDSGVDDRTGVPIHSLYGEVRKPTAEMLDGVEVLLFDIQDIGARYYTYVYTMALGMEAAGEAGIPFVVLDRVNPIGGDRVQGNVLDPAFSSFVGMYPIPMRHGMTPGELARLFAAEFGVQVDLHVVPVSGWERDTAFDDTGLPWRAPSPNMPSAESGLHYPGTCLFEGTNLSVGRGTARPFQAVGAPWLDGDALVEVLNGYGLEDTHFEAVSLTPTAPSDGKYADEEMRAVAFQATGPAYDPTRAAVAVLVEARRAAGDRWEWRPSHFDRLAGTRDLRSGVDAGRTLAELTAGWDGELEEFLPLRARHLIYP